MAQPRPIGDPFDERDPTVFTLTAFYPDPRSLEPVVAAIDGAADGPSAAEGAGPVDGGFDATAASDG